MEYPLLTPPFEVEKFDEMNESEAKKHFDWYISEIPNRLELLEKAIKLTNKNSDFNLDYTKESLIDLWKWYLKNVQIVPKSDDEYNKELLTANEMTRQFIRKEKIATGWMAIALDISIYFAECLIKNNEVLRWGIISKPRSLACVNKPVIVGFSNNMQLDSTNILFIQTRKVLKGIRKENALLQLFENWESHL